MSASETDLSRTDLSSPDLLPRPPAPTVWPSVGFADVDAGVRLLTEGLGFVVTAMHRDGDGVVQHAEARRASGGGVMFGSRGKPGAWGALGPQGVYVVAADAADVDATWDRVGRIEGVEVLQEVHDTDYGSHEFGVRDADGNLWSVGTYRGA
jgi:uncharacterized glyoxalase superfamily protein PhnB